MPEGDEDETDVPYSKRASWKDVTPVPQDDGPHPLAAIRYPPGFAEVHDYFRAIQQRNEFSERALALTADVIEHNSANYTAWYYRRRCLKELSWDLNEELEFADKWARDCPKNYQVWYHRRWIITEMIAGIKRESKAAEEAEQQIRELGQRELEYHDDVMQVNEDYKNYNGWSHRQFIVSKFRMWGKEFEFVEGLLRDDVRNNSAWNHRYTVVKNTLWPLSEESRRREIGFALSKLRVCADNESAWNYLAAFLGEGEGRCAWNAEPEIEAFVGEVLAMVPDPAQRCRFAVEALAKVREAQGEAAQAAELYASLAQLDRIRQNYWEWKRDALLRKL